MAVVAVVFMASEFSGRQPATVALDVGISVLKLIMPVLIALAVQEVISKDIERRFYLYSLSYPNSRSQVLLGKLASVVFISIFLVILIAIGISVSVNIVALGYDQATPVNLGVNYWVVIGFFIVDVLSIVGIATLLSTISSTFGFLLVGTLGYTLVARSFSGVIELLKGSSVIVENPETYESSISVLSFVLPDLGSLDVRTIALYDDLSLLPQGWELLMLTIAFHTVAVVCLSVAIFSNRRFG